MNHYKLGRHNLPKTIKRSKHEAGFRFEFAHSLSVLDFTVNYRNVLVQSEWLLVDPVYFKIIKKTALGRRSTMYNNTQITKRLK